MIGRADTPAGRSALTPRALRLRNVALRRGAARLGLRLPSDAELAALPHDISLQDALARWQPADQLRPVARAPVKRPVALRLAWISAITLVGLALTYGQAQ